MVICFHILLVKVVSALFIYAREVSVTIIRTVIFQAQVFVLQDNEKFFTTFMFRQEMKIHEEVQVKCFIC